MPKSNGGSGDSPKTPPAITSLSVAGFKSIVDEQSIAIRPLTLLAGANSSGKSSMMQPLVLLKQTLEAPYDPGPLLLNGPNVKFTSVAQFLPISDGHGGPRQITVGIGSSLGTGFEAALSWDNTNRKLCLKSNNYHTHEKTFRIFRDMKPEEANDLMKNWIPPEAFGMLDQQYDISVEVRQERFYLEAEVRLVDRVRIGSHSIRSIKPFEDFKALVSRVIHLPGLRGNPERNYPLTAIGPLFPGAFENYVASSVAHWHAESPEKIKALSDDLKWLGLTWKIEASRINDTQVELRVGRMPRPKKGGAHDLVSIADVGFGVSQTLPVVVALQTANPGQLVYIEQPEIHLHPRAQVAMARLLVNAANRGVHIVAETHSSLILLAVQTLVAEGKIDPSLVGLNWFARSEKDGTTRIKTAELDEAGRFGDWPEDFDEVALEAENRYLSAAESRLAKG